MATTPHAALIHHSLEQAIGQVEDLVPHVYARYFALHPEARALFGSDDDDALKGEMLSKLVLQIMDFAEGRARADLIVSWASDHLAYGVSLHMFPTMFACVRDTLREAAGAHWTAEVDRAWAAQFTGLMTLITAAYQRFVPASAVSQHVEHACPRQGRHTVGD
ncbi:MAG TPA: globin [Macromonas sp.]|nr:globin [Macromonas sp.]